LELILMQKETPSQQLGRFIVVLSYLET